MKKIFTILIVMAIKLISHTYAQSPFKTLEITSDKKEKINIDCVNSSLNNERASIKFETSDKNKTIDAGKKEQISFTITNISEDYVAKCMYLYVHEIPHGIKILDIKETETKNNFFLGNLKPKESMTFDFVFQIEYHVDNSQKKIKFICKSEDSYIIEPIDFSISTNKYEPPNITFNFSNLSDTIKSNGLTLLSFDIIINSKIEDNIFYSIIHEPSYYIKKFEYSNGIINKPNSKIQFEIYLKDLHSLSKDQIIELPVFIQLTSKEGFPFKYEKLPIRVRGIL